MPRAPAFLALLLLPVLAGALPAPVRADGDQDRARAALERGEIRPLDEVLRAVRALVPGDVVALDLEREEGRWRYKLKILTPAGKRRAVKVDAASLKLLDGDDDD
ncbi:PepSY domain-containing protein [uncultured Methylobacterium sp.]|uniref:PepSY domain-containing protein n=1 Tax=uncultured Methylobacterium sp. TaxID=157278 RepID=UPI0035CB003F